MAVCTFGERLLQKATGIRRGRVYPVVKMQKKTSLTLTVDTVG